MYLICGWENCNWRLGDDGRVYIYYYGADVMEGADVLGVIRRWLADDD